MISKDEFLGLVRHALALAGLLLAKYGVLGAPIIDEAVGALMILAAIAWSLWDKRAARKKLAAAKAELPPGAVMANGIGTVPVKAGEG